MEDDILCLVKQEPKAEEDFPLSTHSLSISTSRLKTSRPGTSFPRRAIFLEELQGFARDA